MKRAASGVAAAIVAASMGAAMIPGSAEGASPSTAPAANVVVAAPLVHDDDVVDLGVIRPRLHHACDNGCPKIPAGKFANKKYKKGKMGRSKVYSATDLFKHPKGSKKLLERKLRVSLRKQWGLPKNWPYTPAQGVRRLGSAKSCVARGKRYSPYTYGVGVCQPKTRDLNFTHKQVAQAGVMIACAAGPAWVVASGGSGTPAYVALVQGSGCGFAAWLANS